MRPLTVLIGIVLGSAASISFGLAAVLVIFFILRGRNPELSAEMPHLLESLAAFAVLTALSAGSFTGEIRRRSWRRWAHAATVACLLGLVWLYWPRSA